MPALASRNSPAAMAAAAATTTTMAEMSTSATSGSIDTTTTTLAAMAMCNFTTENNNEYRDAQQLEGEQLFNNRFYQQSPPPLPPPLGHDVDMVAPSMEAAASSVVLNGNLKSLNVVNGNYANNNNNNNNNNSNNNGIESSSQMNCANLYNCNKLESSASTADGVTTGNVNKSILSVSSNLLQASREDVVSLGGASSITSQLSAATVNNNNNNNGSIINNNNNNNNGNHQQNNKNNENIGGILKNSKEHLLQNYYNGNGNMSQAAKLQGLEDPGDGLGPLPSNWETAYTERGELYFIDHNTGTSHWLDPRLSKFQKKSLEDCGDDELPYGWEKIEDSLYGTYYIDHVNRKTQYENPVLEAKRRAAEQSKQHPPQQPPPPPPPPVQQLRQQIDAQPLYATTTPTTKNIAEAITTTNSLLNGNLDAAITTTTAKTVSTLITTTTAAAITTTATMTPPTYAKTPTISDIARRAKLQPPTTSILHYKFTRNPLELQGERISTQLVKSPRGLGITIVGGDEAGEDFLQIKSIVPHGPAWIDGKLQTGDVLVYVNDICVLGFTHHDMVGVFQSILPGETVSLEVCRGYTLPFDPNDPNTEVVTTNAVDNITETNLDNRSSAIEATYSVPNNRAFGGFILKKKPEIITVSVLKAATGFGFTIADCDQGQKVKKILDRQCSAQVQEGDILIEVNGVNVQHKTHQEVVQLLKDCSKVQPTHLKLQRQPNTNESNANTLSGNVAKLRKNFLSNVALFRSKTPTAELYSTQQKEILPMRPKTPLVDTRRARVQTPNNEFQQLNAADNLNADLQKFKKSSNSLQDIESINADIPYMDAYPKMVSRLGERLSEVTLHNDNLAASGSAHLRMPTVGYHAVRPASYEHQDYIGAGQYNATYALPNTTSITGGPLHHNMMTMTTTTQPLYASVGYPQQPTPPLPVAATHAAVPALQHQRHQPHESCYCFDCQDYRAANRFRANQTMDCHQLHYSPSALSTATLPSNMPLPAAHIQNERIQKRVNDLLHDRRKVGLSTLEISQTQQQQQQQHSPSVNSLTSQSAWLAAGAAANTASHMQTTLLDHAPAAEQYELTEVTLERQITGFGFRIVGGTEEGSQVTVGHVVPGGAADMDHRINMGDEILSIDGINVLNTSHHKVVSLMGEAATRGYVTMILRRKVRNSVLLHQQQQQQPSPMQMQQYSIYANQQQSQPQQQQQQQQQQQIYSQPHATHLLLQPHAQQEQHQQLQQQQQRQHFHASPRMPQTPHFPYDVIVSRHENEGFGFVIISSTNQYYGSTIGKLIPGSPADRCGELKVGDRIVAVNRIDIAGMPHGDVVNLIKESGLHVRLTIGCPKEVLPTGISPSQFNTSTDQCSPRQLVASHALTQPSPTLQQQQHVLAGRDKAGNYFADRTPTYVNNISPALNVVQAQQQQPQL